VSASDFQAELDDFDAALKTHEEADTQPPPRAERAKGLDPDAPPAT
jgi:hypothetical protein